MSLIYFPILLCYPTGRSLLGCSSSSSLQLSCWLPYIQNGSFWRSPCAWGSEKCHTKQDQVNREHIPVRRFTSPLGTAGYLAHPVLSFTCDHSSRQPIVATNHVAYTHDLYLSTSCWRPSALGVIFQLLAPFIEPLVSLKNTCVWNTVIRIHLLQHFKCLGWSFSQSDQNFKIYSFHSDHSWTNWKRAGVNKNMGNIYTRIYIYIYIYWLQKAKITFIYSEDRILDNKMIYLSLLSP